MPLAVYHAGNVAFTNASEARRYAHGLRIVAVKTFPQALRALATLARKG